ncbi:putative nuclease HARBI1 isoform X1 [Dreissena polymorpha]|nr:putative nuclease HARBI1 isoform X1 [Dreissena polymorpha]XP_052235036.1 putative nuclease HARBI1 isoform X2 [Dreissena polymorpha]XP_052263895.1 putative nuclease HARBI1 isoform X1 [Dreissena polymorpha]XP_052265652.1 putative nuclease HARBI1 isoform X1 [Dreissena polymorpha]
MAEFVALFDVNEQNRRRQRVFRERVNILDELRDEEIIARYRLSREAITYLNETLRVDLEPKTKRSNSLSSLTQVLIGLRFLSKGDFFSEVADIHGVSKPTAARCFHVFIDSLNRRLHNIRFPTENGAMALSKQDFYRRCRIPNVLGAVDGTLVPILGPSENEEAYICRKGFHAINVQAVCDSRMNFIDVVAKWPGSQHDASIFNTCGLKEHLERTHAGILLGDSGYGLRRYLLTPKQNPMTESERRYNNYHARGRVVIERAFGVLKSRFRCLHKSGGVLPFNPTKSSHVVVACMKLHNLCITFNVKEPQDAVHVNELANEDVLNEHDDNAHSFRQAIINMF